MSVYIFTLPKAGTYFLAELLNNMGLNNTGYHIFHSFYLDTKKFTLKQNATSPGIAKIQQFFVAVVRQMKENDVAFGHFPLPLNPAVAPSHMKYICAYRHPRKTLVAEFIDFRFRRTDIVWLSQKKVKDDKRAFELYMQRHGAQVHLRDLKNVLLYRRLMNLPLTEADQKDRAHFVNFEKALKDPNTVREIGAFLGIEMSADEAKTLHKKTLAAKTKTKAVDLEIDRDALWTSVSKKIYADAGFPRLVAMARKQGLTL